MHMRSFRGPCTIDINLEDTREDFSLSCKSCRHTDTSLSS